MFRPSIFHTLRLSLVALFITVAHAFSYAVTSTLNGSTLEITLDVSGEQVDIVGNPTTIDIYDELFNLEADYGVTDVDRIEITGLADLSGQKVVFYSSFNLSNGLSVVDVDFIQIAEFPSTSITTDDGDITLIAAGSVDIEGVLQTIDGDITVEGKGNSGGTYEGIEVGSSILTLGNGSISIIGKGGNVGSSGDNHGIRFFDSSTEHKIESLGSGSITVIGRGGTVGRTSGIKRNSGQDYTITSLDGDIQMIGEGGSGIEEKTGISGNRINVHSNGLGNITVEGKGGLADNTGVSYGINQIKSITTTSGSILVKGIGGGGDSFKNGIFLFNGDKIKSGGMGSTTVEGRSDINNDAGSGVGLTISNAEVSASGGNVIIRGYGGGLGQGADGLLVERNSVVRSEGTGNITMEGYGSNGSSSGQANGVKLSFGAQVTAVGGNISMLGIGGNDGNSFGKTGIDIGTDVQISTGGSGDISLHGTGGNCSFFNAYGIRLISSTPIISISTTNGNINLTGIGGTNECNLSTSSNNGIDIIQGKVIAGGQGNVVIAGTSGQGSSSYGVSISDNVETANGNISITGIGNIDEGNNDNSAVVISGSLKTGGVGDIVIDGTSSQNNICVQLQRFDGMPAVETVDGNISISGFTTFAMASASGYGVLLNCILQSTGKGDITITGSVPNSQNLMSKGIQFPFGTNTGKILTNEGDIVLNSSVNPLETEWWALTFDNNPNLTVRSLMGNIAINSSSLGTRFINGVNPEVEAPMGEIILTNAVPKFQFSSSSNDILQAIGKVNVTDANLEFYTFFDDTYQIGQTYLIIDNDGSDPIIGTFQGLSEGAVIPNFVNSGLGAKISYIGGDGNDVTLEIVESCNSPDIPQVTATNSTLCPGGSTTLSFSNAPALNEATQWVWYSGSCGGTQVGTGTSITVSPSSTSTYFVRGEGGCATGGTCGDIVITVNPLDDPSFSYANSAYCVDDTDPVPTITGLQGGTFSAIPVGLTIDGTTGAVDLDLSTVGTYTITYMTAGSCPNSTTQMLTVNALDDASFAYTTSTYCTDDTNNPSPTITGVSGGTFSATPTGLAINTTTGEIDISGSIIGTYTVTYSVNAVCSNTSTQTITIDANCECPDTDPNTFIGTDKNFNVATNWSLGCIPTIPLVSVITIDRDLDISTVPSTMTVASGGSINVLEGRTLNVDATITVMPGGSITNNGKIINTSTITYDGTFTNNGTYTGNGTFDGNFQNEGVISISGN